MKEILYKIAKLDKADDYDGVLKEIKKLEQNSLLPLNILVLKGTCIRLSDNQDIYSLEDAEKSYKKALAIDPDYVEALIELGYFYLDVMDDAKKAFPYFEDAIRVIKGQVNEAFIGHAFCMSELESPDKAINLIQNLQISIDKEKVEDSIKKIRSTYSL